MNLRLLCGSVSVFLLWGGTPALAQDADPRDLFLTVEAVGHSSWFETGPSLAFGYRLLSGWAPVLRLGRTRGEAPPEGTPGAVRSGQTTLELVFDRRAEAEPDGWSPRILWAVNATVADRSRVAYDEPSGYHFRGGPKISQAGARGEAVLVRHYSLSPRVRVAPGAGLFAELRTRLPWTAYYAGSEREVRTGFEPAATGGVLLVAPLVLDLGSAHRLVLEPAMRLGIGESGPGPRFGVLAVRYEF